MPVELRLVSGLVFATALAYACTPLVIRLADRLDFYDHPAGGYKDHARPTPYLGGLAVLAAFAAAALVFSADARTIPIVMGAVVLWAVGTADDRRPLSPVLRLAVEAGAAAVLWALDLGWSLGAGAAVDLAATVLWVTLVINAFNIFDNMDGVASSVAAVTSGAMAIVGLTTGNPWLAVLAAALSGACWGFLPHNVSSPARIFLGDGGSMPIGFALAVLPMVGLADAAPEWQSLGMGLLFVGIPGVDLVMRWLARRRAGTPFLAGGRDGLAQWWRRRLGTARSAALVLGATQAIVSLMAILALHGGSPAIASVVVAYVAACALAVAVLDVREREAALAAEGLPDLAHGGHVPPAATARTQALRLGVLVALAAGLGVSPFFGGFYEPSIWLAIGLVLVVLVTATAIAQPVALGTPALIAVATLGSLAVWAVLSASWADSIERAITDGNRLLVYAVLLLGVLLVLRRDRHGEWLLAALGGAVVALGLFVVGRMAFDPGGLFLAGRLGEPLGYINGQGGFFVVGLWPCLALAAHRRSALLAGLGMAGGVLIACLLLASQSRGVAFAVAVSAAACIALVPGRVRQTWAIIAAVAGVVAASPWVLDIYSVGLRAPVPEDVSRAAALATVAAALGAGAVWAAITWFVARAGSPAVPRRIAASLLALGAIAACGVAVAEQARLRSTVTTQYNAFVHLAVEPQGAPGDAAQSRLLSGVGNRYDYWRIAWNAFETHPVRGVGAGNYAQPYFQQRSTTEDIRQPHSIGLQTLSELGIIGGLLLIGFVGVVLVGARRRARLAVDSPGSRIVVVGALGAFVAWLAHTSVDWLHLLPGVSGIALCAAAILVARPDRAATTAARSAPVRRYARVPAIAAAVGLLTITGVSLTRSALAEHYRGVADESLAARPGAALINADRALRLDRENIDAYYIKAAALARFGRGDASQRTLEEALRREPRNFVTWALLGDLAVRRGDLTEAKRAYSRASALNPREPGLRVLAADPAQASASGQGG